jgi:hypothetical protein
METLNVYWSMHGAVSKITYANLVFDKPKKLLKTLKPIPEEKDLYLSCSAAQDLYKNTFVINSPFSSNINILGNEEAYTLDNQKGYWLLRDYTLDNRIRIDFDFGHIFFAEEPVKMTMYPPYMHKTKSMNNATVAAGRYDISKWFRPINPSFILWENEKSLSIEKDEPLVYIDFETDKKVILKQFDLTEELQSVINQNLFYRDMFPHTKLNELYDRFTRSNRHKLVSRLIKESLLD